MSEKFWTDEKITRLKDLIISREYTAQAIGSILGCSKNSVIGKARRVRVSFFKAPAKLRKARSRAIRRRPQQLVAPTSHVDKVSIPPESIFEHKEASMSEIKFTGSMLLFDSTSHHCRMIIGEVDGLDTKICGRPKFRGSYCKECHPYVYREDIRLKSKRPRVST